MAQVLSSANMQEFIETRKVPEFVPPDAKKAEEAKPEVKEEVAAKAEVEEAEDDDGLTPSDAELTEKIRRKIGAKHKRMKEAEEFAEAQYNERRLAEKRAEIAEQRLADIESKAKPQPEQAEVKKPDPKDFPDAIQYAEALAEFKVNEAIERERAKRAEEAAQAERERAQALLRERIAKVAKDIPDYDEVVSAADAQLPVHVSQFIVDSESGPKVGYHLAKHPEVLERISKLSPIKAIAELGKLEAALEAGGKVVEVQSTKTTGSEAVKTQERSRAPDPIKPIEGGTAPVQKDPSKMTYQEFRAWEKSQAKAENPQRRVRH